MKSILSILLLSAVVALGQTNLSPQEIEARRARAEAATEELRAMMQATVAKAEAARSNHLANPPVKGFGTEEKFVTPPIVVKSSPPYYNTNYSREGFGTMLQLMEKHYPGISTNYTPEQRAMTSSRPIIRATVGPDGKIIFLSTNAPGTRP